MRSLLIGAGAIVAVAGVIFTLQGVGAIGGSVMSGPVIALCGIALAVAGLRRHAG